jgi:hypothetical protein
MASCVLFACSIKPGREFVLRLFLDSFVNVHKQSDIYIGINPHSSDELVNIINEYELNTFVYHVDPNLYSESDASAYQLCLKALLQSEKEYDNYWFIHTKSGFNSHSDYLRDWYISNFVSRKQEIELFFSTNPGVGSYGILGLEYDTNRIYQEHDVEISLWDNNISKDLPYTHAKFFYIHTIYCLSKEPIKKFFNLVTDTWFNTKLNRYYFEGVFPFLVSRSGYFPYLENRFSMNGADLLHYIDSWIKENSLNQYNYLLNNFKTEYTFNQLQPPYVNRNA